MVGAIIGATSALAACAGFFWTIKTWKHSQSVKRAEFLKALLAKFEDTNTREIFAAMEKEDSARELFEQIKSDFKKEKDIDAIFSFLSYLCYLLNHNLISEIEFGFFEYQIRTLLQNEYVKSYLDSMYRSSSSADAENPFVDLMKYARKCGIIDRGVGSQVCDEDSSPRNGKNITEDDFTEPTMVIKINRLYHEGMNGQEIYDTTRGWWRVSRGNCEKVKLALAVVRGIVIEVFRVNGWKAADGTAANGQSRLQFEGERAEESIRQKFCGRSVAGLFAKGAANPIRYFGMN